MHYTETVDFKYLLPTHINNRIPKSFSLSGNLTPGSWNISGEIKLNAKQYTFIEVAHPGGEARFAIDPPWNKNTHTIPFNFNYEVKKDFVGFITIQIASQDYNASAKITSLRGLHTIPVVKTKKDCTCDLQVLMGKGCQCGGE